MTDIDYSKPFTVRIIEDCRKESRGKLDGQYGVCLGLYVYPNPTKKANKSGNPLIITESGEHIWGCECWWDPEPDEHRDVPLSMLQEIVEKRRKEIMKGLINEIEDVIGRN